MTPSLEERVAAIEERNNRVEADKAWETSFARRAGIAVVTYIVISCTLMVIGHDGAWIHSVVPVLGYLLSTLALRFLRTAWQKKFMPVLALALLLPVNAFADITITLVGPFSGSTAAQGEELKAGADAAIAEINEAGGLIGGQKLALKIEDDACNATQATVVANKIVAKPPAGVIGPLCSAATLSSAAIYAENGVPQITLSSNPGITEAGHKNLFRLVGRDDRQAPDLVTYLGQNYPKDTRFAVIDDKGSWGLTFADLATAELKKSGYAVALRDAITPGQKDFSALITRLKTEKIKTVVIGLYVTEAALLVRQAREQGFTGDFFGGDPIQTPEFAKVAGAAAEGIHQSGLFDPRGNPAGDKLMTDLQKAKKPIGVYTFYAYVAVKVYADAIIRANSAKPADIIKALGNTAIDSMIGPIKFDDKGDLRHFTYSIFVWKNGQAVPAR